MTQTPEPPNNRIDRKEAALGRFALLTKLKRSQTITKGLTKFWKTCLGSPATGEVRSSSNLLKCAIASTSQVKIMSRNLSRQMPKSL